MLWKVFYVLGFLSQLGLGYEIEEYDFEAPYEFLSSEEFEDDFPMFLEALEKDNHEVLEQESEELTDDDDDAGAHEDAPAESGIIFAGPVKAKGTVSMAATFGYDASTSSPPVSGISAFGFPPVFPQYYLQGSPQFVSPMPFTFSHIPLLSMFLPGLEVPEKKHKDNADLKPASKEIFLEATPLKHVDKNLAVASNPANPSVELLSSAEILAHPVTFLEDDFTDYDEEEVASSTTDDLNANEAEQPAGMAFAGLVPASGTVKIAARF